MEDSADSMHVAVLADKTSGEVGKLQLVVPVEVSFLLIVITKQLQLQSSYSCLMR